MFLDGGSGVYVSRTVSAVSGAISIGLEMEIQAGHMTRRSRDGEFDAGIRVKCWCQVHMARDL